LDNGIEIEDLGSSNGTRVYRASDLLSARTELGDPTERAESRVQAGVRTELALGQMFRLGSVLFVVQARKHSKPYEARRETTRRAGEPPILVDEEMRRIYKLAVRTAATDISVLLLGETGVGKEVLAETIHFRSPRASQPFLRLNCAALSESLLESELFGYERGAFTGAHQMRVGLLESSTGGTVFLDEIGELPNTIQVKLLRVLEERSVRRIGSNRARPIDVRFITATNRDLRRQVARGAFREDLYFRINGVHLLIPPLRERRSEILPLAEYFLSTFCRKSGLPLPILTDEAKRQLMGYSWPGNVRELRNIMERAPFLCGGDAIRPEHVPGDPVLGDDSEYLAEDIEHDHTDVFNSPTQIQSESSERDRIVKALEACGGNQTRAARILGMSRRTLVNRLDEYGLPRPRKR
jgi:DNA-binding NtrC family response regulator